jgi:hypothetical protein
MFLDGFLSMKTIKKSSYQSWSSNNLKNKEQKVFVPVKQGGTIYGSVYGATDINDDDLIVSNSRPPQDLPNVKFPGEEKLKEIREGLGIVDEEESE